MGIKVAQDFPQLLLVKERIGDEVTLADKPDKEQASDQTNNLLLNLLTVILWNSWIIGVSNARLFVYRPEKPLEKLVLEVLRQCLYREGFPNRGERNPYLL